MKLFATLAACATAASWPGQMDGSDAPGVGQSCGTTVSIKANAVNSTCTIDTNGFNAIFMSVAGSFPTGANTYVGFPGASNDENQEVFVMWMEGLDADGMLDNSTCGTDADISITCVDDGSMDATANLVGNFIMDPRQTHFGVPVANGDADFAFDMTAFAGTNLTSGHCEVVCTGMVCACDLSTHFGQLSYVEFDGVAGSSNFQ